MANFDVEEIATRFYELDKKVYEATESKMGKVFPAGKEISVKKLIKKIETDKRHFVRDETMLISNMIATIKNSETADKYRKELDDLKVVLEKFSPAMVLPDSYESNISKRKEKFGEGAHRILCIGREYGSGGHEIGFRLAEKLGISYYDKEILKMACEHLGKEFPEDDDYGIKKSIFDRKYKRFPGFRSNDDLFFAQSSMIEEMARKEDCIFMGRCADVVLEHADIPRISIFIGAPFDERVKHEMSCTGIDRDSAVEMVHHMDKSRKYYYNYYTGRHWGHSENYDMCINTACYGIDGTVDMIEKMFDMF